MLALGSKAPDFKLQLDTGRSFHLRSTTGKRILVVAFFPEDFSKDDLADAEAFFPYIQQAQSFGALVLVICPKPMQRLRRLLAKHELSLAIASDPTLEVCRNYRAMWLRGLGLRRIMYVIDRKGTIRGRVSNQLLDSQPWEQTLEVLRELDATNGLKKKK